MAISDNLLEELRMLLGLQDIITTDDELLETGLAIASFVLVRQMKELQGATKDA